MQFRPKTQKSGLDSAIDECLHNMTMYPEYSDEYAKMADQLTKLYKLKETKDSRRVSPDTTAVVGGNILIALIVVAYEQKNVITTKVLSFFAKAR